jgi:transposase-like protein
MDNPGEPPIFLDPIFIHDNSDFESYSNFFNHLRVKLISTDTSNLVIGCDEEYALVSSIQTSFPEAGHIHCIRHLRLNIKHKLTDECIDKPDRETILNDI